LIVSDLFLFHHSIEELNEIGSWYGTEVLREETFDVVVSVVGVVELPEGLWIVILGVSVSVVGVTIVINDWIIRIMLDLVFLVIVSITVGKLIRVLD